jgi:hypothetical protein
MHSDRNPTTAVHRPSRAVWWVIAISLAVIAVCMVTQSGDSVLPPAVAQATRQAGARGVFAFSGQLSDNSYGLFMVDVDAGTMWCYEYIQGKKKFRLAGARSWVFDRYLENQDFEGPTPDDVKKMVDQQRENRLRQRGLSQP